MHCSELKRSLHRFFWNWNKQNASVAQLVARILGKDEVGGSSPLGSLEKKQAIMSAFFIFFAYLVEKKQKMWYANTNYRFIREDNI